MDHEGLTLRPVVGRLIVGGNLFKTLNSDEKGDWLKSDNPYEYLYSPWDIGESTQGVVRYFITPAMEDSRLADFLFDVPIVFGNGNGYVKAMDNINVFYLPEGHPWKETFYVATLKLNEDLLLPGIEGGKEVRMARVWDCDWFFSRLLESLNEAYVQLLSEYEQEKNVERGRELARLLTENKFVSTCIKCLV